MRENTDRNNSEYGYFLHSVLQKKLQQKNITNTGIKVIFRAVRGGFLSRIQWFQNLFQNSLRSSHRRCFIKRAVFQNLAKSKFTGKHLCQSLFFNKAADLRLWHRCFRPATFLRKRLWHRCFPVNYAKIILQNTSKRLFP